MEETLQNNKSLWELFETITQLDGREECGQFFRDLCTLTELELMAERWLVARMITQHISYRRISELTGTSTATVTPDRSLATLWRRGLSCDVRAGK